MVERAVILAATARTAVGRSLLASAAAVRAGLARLVADPALCDARGKAVVTARASWLPEDVDQRAARLARPAAFQAMAAVRDRPGRRVRAFVGVASKEREGRTAGLDAALRGAVEQAVARAGTLVQLELVAADHAAGLIALDRALHHLSQHPTDLCLVGGADSWLNEGSIAALDEHGRVRTGRHRFGFTPGEAAAFLLLAAPDYKELPAVGAVLASSTATERAEVNVGEALTSCFREVLSGLGPDERVERLFGDLNGEPWRADELGMSLLRCGASLVRGNSVLSPVSSWGDVGAASGPLGVGLFLAARQRGWGPRSGLVWTSSMSGERAAALVRA